MKGYVGNIINMGVVSTLAVIFGCIIGSAFFHTNPILLAIGITGIVTAGVIYLTSKQKWVEY